MNRLEIMHKHYKIELQNQHKILILKVSANKKDSHNSKINN